MHLATRPPVKIFCLTPWRALYAPELPKKVILHKCATQQVPNSITTAGIQHLLTGKAVHEAYIRMRLLIVLLCRSLNDMQSLNVLILRFDV